MTKPPSPTTRAPSPNVGTGVSTLTGLPGRLLLLTVLFVMLSEIFIFLPSIANFRVNWLRDRIKAASIATLVARAAPDGQLPEMLKSEVLMRAGVRGIALKTRTQRQLILDEPMPPTVDASYDLRSLIFFGSIKDALAVYFEPGERVISVSGWVDMGTVNDPQVPENDAEMLEVVLSEAPLQAEMIRWGLGILGLSVIISLFTAGLVYLALYGLLVRPLQRLVSSMMRFASDPEAPGAIITPSGRRDEIGVVERELARMQRELATLLKARGRLASLGLAVSKINHDLRNILSSAQLMSDRLASVEEPAVQRMTPILLSSLDRAIRLCTDTLSFGRATEPDPVRRHFRLAPLVDEVGAGLGLPRQGAVRIDWHNMVAPDIDVYADRDQLFRILGNLCRNAVQVLELQPAEGRRMLAVSAAANPATVVIEVVDSGPGVPERARAKMFVPFEGGVRPGGTGLGLAIVAELVKANGGTVELVDRPDAGAVFRITLPAGPTSPLVGS